MLMATKRVKEMAPIEREIIKMIFDDACKLPHDGRWRKYQRNFTFEGKQYSVTCSFCYDALTFQYRNMVIVAETKTIFIDPLKMN